MGLDLSQAIKKFREVLDTTHQDYKRVVDLSDLYHTLITGKDYGNLLIRYNPREDKDQFAQRNEVTTPVTPAISNKAMSQFMRVPRIDNIRKEFILKNDTEENRNEFQQSISTFYGDKSLEHYNRTMFINTSFKDPNAFVAVNFNEFDESKEIAKPYPLDISSRDAINYEYENNVIQWLMVNTNERIVVNRFKNPDSSVDTSMTQDFGASLLMIVDDYFIKITEIDEDASPSPSVIAEQEDVESLIIRVDYRVFRLDISNHKAGRVPVVRVGYIPDLDTDSRTYVSPLHPAVSRMLSTIKSNSELSLSLCLHTFPHKIVYVDQCDGTVNDHCSKGRTVNGNTCSVCNGTGRKKVQKSSSDVIEVLMPREAEDMIDLNKLISFTTPPIELLEFQNELVLQLEQECLRDVFPSSETREKAKMGAITTATQSAISEEDKYDTLFSFSEQYSYFYMEVATLVAIFTDKGEDFKVFYKFPSDFKLKSVAQLIIDLESAKKSGASPFIITKIERDIAEKMYVDNPHMLKKHDTVLYFMPFPGLNNEQVTLHIGQGKTRKSDVTLYYNYEQIMSKIEFNNPEFYSFDRKRQVKIVDDMVQEFQKQIDQDAPVAIDFAEKE